MAVPNEESKTISTKREKRFDRCFDVKTIMTTVSTRGGYGLWLVHRARMENAGLIWVLSDGEGELVGLGCGGQGHIGEVRVDSDEFAGGL